MNVKVKSRLFALLLALPLLLAQSCTFGTVPICLALGIVLQSPIQDGEWFHFWKFYATQEFEWPAGRADVSGKIWNSVAQMPEKLYLRAAVYDQYGNPQPQQGKWQSVLNVEPDGVIRSKIFHLPNFLLEPGDGILFSVKPSGGKLDAGDTVDIEVCYTGDLEGKVCQPFHVSTGFLTSVEKASVNPSGLATAIPQDLSGAGGVKVHCQKIGTGKLTVTYSDPSGNMRTATFNLKCN